MSSRLYPRQLRRRPYGYTIIEFMIAMTIGLFLLVGIATVFANSLRARNDVRVKAELNDNGRYAISILTAEFNNAGFLGEFNTSLAPTPTAAPDPCSTTMADLTSAMVLGVQGIHAPTSAPSCVSDFKTGTDIIVTRRTSTCALGDVGCEAAVAGAPYFQASQCNSGTELQASSYTAYFALATDRTTLGLHQKDCTTPASVRRYRVSIFYVANNDTPGDGIPTLKRLDLGANSFELSSVAQGIEQLQAVYAIDAGFLSTPSALNGIPGAFIAEPGSYNACAGVVCQSQWRNVVVAGVRLLARASSPVQGYTDTKTYQIGSTTLGPFNDSYRRSVYQARARLYNAAGRNGA